MDSVVSVQQDNGYYDFTDEMKESIRDATNNSCLVISNIESRQKSARGCPIFALRDQKMVGKIPNFYDYLHQNGFVSENSEFYSIPPQFMRSTQSMNSLTSYESSLDDKHKQKSFSETLEKVKKHSIKVGNCYSSIRNASIDYFTDKYSRVVKKIVSNSTPSKLEEILNQHDGNQIIKRESKDPESIIR